MRRRNAAERCVRCFAGGSTRKKVPAPSRVPVMVAILDLLDAWCAMSRWSIEVFGADRFSMLETSAQFAEEQWFACHREDRVRGRHSRYSPDAKADIMARGTAPTAGRPTTGHR